MAFSTTALGQEEQPFWRQKPKLMKQLTEQRKIIVSVVVEDSTREKKIRLIGAGVLNTPLAFAADHLARFEELPKVSSYFKKVKLDREKNEVYFFIQAFGKQIRFIQKFKWGRRDGQEAQMDWIVTWGSIKGMVGHYKLRKISATQTEISVWANMKKIDLPLPEFLINFTLEVIAEKTAQKMRAFIEDSYKNALTVREKNVKK